MEWLVDASWREYPAAVVMLAGGIVALIGARCQADGITRPISDPAKAITWMRGFRQTVLGLAVLGTAAAWLWQAPWLLALSLIIGAGEIFESSLDVWALTKGKDLRLGPRTDRR
jgi:hypothetical protein